MELFTNNQLNVSIVVNDVPDATDNNAVYELCLGLKSCFRKDVVVYNKQIAGDTKNIIYVGGNNANAIKAGVKIPRHLFEEDTVYILIKDNFILLDGGVRGKLYAVYEFLERFLGVRYFAPSQIKFPLLNKNNFVIENCEIIYTPDFKYRHLWSNEILFDRVFANRSRCNQELINYSFKNFGGGLEWATPGSHTVFDKLLAPEDPENGFDKHPEYFSYIKSKGKRVGRHYKIDNILWGEGDVCWSNKNALNVVIKQVKEWILEQEDKIFFSVSQPDFKDHCECEECTKLAEYHGEKGKPRWGALYFYAVNEIAKEIKEWQKKDIRVKNRTIYIETMAYDYGVFPPCNMIMEDNVVIRLCGPRECVLHPLGDETCIVNKKFMEAVEEWSKICKHLYVWHYAGNASMPVFYTTFFNVMQKNLQFFASKNVFGIFNEFTYFTKSATIFNVRQYLYAKLLWNPYIDFAKEYKEAMEFFYEDGAENIMEVEKSYIDHALKMKNFHPRDSMLITKNMYSKEFFENGERLFEDALKKVRSAKAQYNIRYEYAIFNFIRAYVMRDIISPEVMKAVIEELEFMGVPFERLESFKLYFFEGKHDDYFDEQLAERNLNADLKRIDELSITGK